MNPTDREKGGRIDVLRRHVAWIAACFLLVSPKVARSQEATTYEYIFPKPNSEYLQRGTGIIIRFRNSLDLEASANSSLLTVHGSTSGDHRGETSMSDDGKVLVFQPERIFDAGETVTVSVGDAVMRTSERKGGGFTFRFSISLNQAGQGDDAPFPLMPGKEGERVLSMPSSAQAVQDSLPPDFPPIRIDTLRDPGPGQIFLANFGTVSGTSSYGHYLMILENTGKPSAYKKIANDPTTFAYNFKRQSNGLLAFIEKTSTNSTVWVLDTMLNVVESFSGGNGYNGDVADFRMLPNGHAFLLLYDWQNVDMSKIVPGGNPGARVAEAVIQELDPLKRVVFQWRSFDHIPITDGYVDSLAGTIDYIHANGFEFDDDGGILLSSRHLSEITKINGRTGEIIWRLGGKKNQFQFVGEHEIHRPNFFSFQHNVSRLTNGHLMLFDNGNQHSPQYSRAVEYELDEIGKVATLIWEYRHIPDIFSSANGSAQRLSNGNTVVGWGNAGLTGLPSVTEVRPDRSPVFELTLPKGQRSWTVNRFPWKDNPVSASFSRTDLYEGNTYSFNGASALLQTGVTISFQQLQPVFYNGITVTKYSTSASRPQFVGDPPVIAFPRFVITRDFGVSSVLARVIFAIASLNDLSRPAEMRVYRRDTVGSGTFLPLPTSYDSISRELSATTSGFGEFIFGWSRTDTVAAPPLLFSPPDRDSLNYGMAAVLRWNPTSYHTGYHLQVSTDSLFNSPALHDTLLTNPADTLKNLRFQARYYWRVRTSLGVNYSPWSPPWSFTAVGPYIAVLSPKAKETWRQGKSYYIRWHSNISDLVRIDLFRNGELYRSIKDSVKNVGWYSWTVQTSLPIDSAYAFRIRSVNDSLVSGFSSHPFAVGTPTAINDNPDYSPTGFHLSQNYPNPFNPRTTIRYQLPKAASVSLKIFNTLGQLVATIVDEHKEPGTYQAVWNPDVPSGIYFYRLQAGDLWECRKMLLLQ